MRFLVDASLSPIVSRLLIDNGHDAIHVGDILPLNAKDGVILDRAVNEQRIIVAADTDFGELLARRGTTRPSAVLFHRQVGRRPREQAATLLANLPDVEADLRDGAIVVIEDQRLRVRSLPIGRRRDTEPD